MAKYVEQPISVSDPGDRYASSVLDRLADILLAENTKGYLIRLITEPLPLLGIWSLGDLLGFLTGWRDHRAGFSPRGMLKMITAAVPGFPTIPSHFVIDKLFPVKQTRLS